MDFATLQTDFPALLGDLLGVTCQWRTQPLKAVQGASAVVDLLGIASVDVDERVWTDTGAGTTVTETQHGGREVTVQVTAWSSSQLIQQSARSYLERLRTRLRFRSSLDRLRAMGLAIVAIEQVVGGDIVQDARARSQASLDVRLAFGVSETDTAIPFIGAARVKSEHLRNAADEPLPASLQIDVNPPAGA